MSVPNQKVLIITKPQTTTAFLTNQCDDWQTALKELSPSALEFIYTSRKMRMDINMNTVQPPIENTGIMSKGTATKARQELEKKGYIDDGRFYESPTKRKLRERNKR